ncbi:DUF1146 family protein [Tuberibacillus sp. Marseille-P3662]|uniref:DUF1146 family protein n=1 Tax=Tuberibacillus sp. Marseille-P3662 TaxID=1965358 RepID=UPI001592B4CA|nr:DUF1146 family protein [Tuberibacillus sp. Marseille-P3662]
MYGLNVQSALNLVVHLITLILTWWALQSFKIDVYFKHPQGPKAKVAMLFIAITISYNVGNFILNYVNWSLNLQNFM